MTALIIGVDPGLTGAIAAATDDEILWVEDMPLVAGEICVALLDKLYDPTEYGPWHLTPDMTVAIEQVHSMPKQGVASTFKFGKAYGLVLGYFAAKGHPIIDVAPTKWKSTFHLNGKDKDAARLEALKLWPAQASWFARKKDIGRADAALIALHQARTAGYHDRIQALRAELAELRGDAA